MKFDETMARLPDGLRSLLSGHPLVAGRLEDGRPLASAFDQVWAGSWVANASPVVLELLRCLLRRFAARPFGEAEAEAAAGQELYPAWTGAEIRIALLRLRTDGILFGAVKSWGDRLLFIPADRIALWHSLLFNEELIPFTQEEEERLKVTRGEGRLPLSWRMLHTWSNIRLRGFPLTAKGLPYKTHSSRLAEEISLDAGELRSFFDLPPEAESLLPAPLALAIELGLELGILYRTPSSIEAGDGAGLDWFDGSMESLDSLLHRIIAERYASADSQLYYAAICLSRLEPFRWYSENQVRSSFRIPGPNPGKPAWDAWVQAATDLGWLEQGMIGEERALRWTIDPSLQPKRPGRADRPVDETAAVYLQSDLEIIVPPEVGFGIRWRLEETGERISLDTVSTYRLTRASCERALRFGYTLERLASMLGQATGEPVSSIVRNALEDWLSGRSHPVEEPGAAARVSKHGERTEEPPFLRLHRTDPLDEYELDGFLPRREELFPGLASIPAAWLTHSRSYHVSTRKDMAEQALAWRTSLRIGPEGPPGYSFLPERVEQGDGSWTIAGRIRMQAGEPGRPTGDGDEMISLSLDALKEIRLELPLPLA
ncbi:hypothetical protein [Cohnella sp. AR92]|uniref:hypothetical protein n=1 Tax=Cohnella sp. AR92 TaxID=648716 RepID=UPI000F8E0212|nr:hypothetical protein [Cohnella sp. AR92]RUS48327.1 hypothetical protein ELR57_02580 [Cohnella sp. AR92]